MDKYCFLDGKIKVIPEASLGVYDIGLLRAYGVFEVLKTYSLKPFLLDKHLDRLESSAFFLGLKLPYSRKEIAKIIDELMRKLQGKEASLRIILTGGRTLNGMDFDSESPTFIIIAEEFKKLAEGLYKEGMALFPVEHQRIFPEIKTLNYIFPIKTQLDIKNKGFFDLLYFFQGKVLESSTSNFFIVKNSVIITPANNILMGITRGFVVDIAKKYYKVEERDVALEEIKTADEAFITATNKEIVPVIKIGETIIGTGLVGENTKKLIDLFKINCKKY